MGKSIYEKIKRVKSGEKDYLEEIIDLFSPIINKYSRLLDGEDTKQDLIIHLIKLINKIPIDNSNGFEEKAILGYIGKSIRNEYIRLSKLADKKKIKEIELDLDIEIDYEEFESEMEMLDLFNVLTEKEAYIMKLIYVYYMSVPEVAESMNITRQSVNQSKNRALKKIEEVYLR